MPPPVDLAIIGGGVIGCAIAWRLAQSGASIALIERGRFGNGASGATAGIIAPLWHIPPDNPPLFQMGLRSLQLFPQWAAELADAGINPEFQQTGILRIALTQPDADDLAQSFQWQSQLNLGVQWLKPDDLRQREPQANPEAIAAVYSPQEGCIRGQRLTHALAHAAAQNGATLYENLPATGLRRAKNRITAIETPNGPIPTGQVILAAGPWSGPAGPWNTPASPWSGPDPAAPWNAPTNPLSGGGPADPRNAPADPMSGDSPAGPWNAPADPMSGDSPAGPRSAAPLNLPVRGVKGQRILLRLPGFLPQSATHNFTGYIAPRLDGNILVASTREEGQFNQTTTAAAIAHLIAVAARAYPNLTQSSFIAARAGIRPATPDNQPIIGPHPIIENLTIATGHDAIGIMLSPATAELTAQYILDRNPTPLKPFTPARFPQPIAHQEF